MSETTATVTCWKLRLNLIVIGWKINCLLKHFNMYSQYTKQTLINSDPLCETLINCKVVRCLMISSNATDRVNMQSQTRVCRDDIIRLLCFVEWHRGAEITRGLATDCDLEPEMKP